jgi:hypothetical protein
MGKFMPFWPLVATIDMKNRYNRRRLSIAPGDVESTIGSKFFQLRFIFVDPKAAACAPSTLSPFSQLLDKDPTLKWRRVRRRGAQI